MWFATSCLNYEESSRKGNAAGAKVALLYLSSTDPLTVSMYNDFREMGAAALCSSTFGYECWKNCAQSPNPQSPSRLDTEIFINEQFLLGFLLSSSQHTLTHECYWTFLLPPDHI